MPEQPAAVPNTPDPPPSTPADITPADAGSREIAPADILSVAPVHTSASSTSAAQIPPTILHTDPVQRRNIALLLGLMALTSALFFLVGLPLLSRWLNVGDLHDVLRRIGILFYLMSALSLAMAIGAALYARRIFRSDAFPPPGSWVWRNTVIKHGQKARILAWLVVACATGFAMIAIYSLILPSHVSRLTLPPALLHAPLPPP